MKLTFFQVLLVILFASAIVLLGTHELAIRYGVHRGSGRAGTALVKELHGQVDIGKVVAGEPKSAKSYTPRAEAGDSLGSSDREELSNLINQVAP